MSYLNLGLTGYTPSGVDDYGNATSFDRVTNRTVVNVPSLNPDPERMRSNPPQVGGGLTAKELLDVERKRDAVKTLRDRGLEVPAAIVNAFAVFDAICGERVVTADAPRIQGMKPDEAVQTMRDFTELRSRETAAKQVKEIYVNQAMYLLERAFGHSTDEVLTQLRPSYDKAAEDFTKNYAVVKGCASITDAATRDQDGTTVTAWHKAVAAAKTLNEVTDIALIMVAPDGLKPRHMDAAELTVPTLLADVAQAKNVLVVATVSEKGRTGKITADFPLGLYAPVLDSGAVLSLPASSEDWEERKEAYEAAKQTALLERWSH